MIVAGVDGCAGGWIAVLLPPSGRATGVFVPTLDELGRAAAGVAAFALDIPLGLPVDGRRRADDEARVQLGPRRGSVFHTPVREALTAPTHREASAISRQRTGKGISQQSYALAPKILEAERWSRDRDVPVWEVHPEVSFTVLLGRPPTSPKARWAGMRERQAALADAGVDLDGIGEAGRRAGTDDVLDAAVAAWSARRLVRGEGICVPDPPERHPGTGQPMAIWA